VCNVSGCGAVFDDCVGSLSGCGDVFDVSDHRGFFFL